jgi:hypothetical protein
MPQTHGVTQTNGVPKTKGEPHPDVQEARHAAGEARSGSPLTPTIRRHLGGALRNAYAAGPTEPPGERITGLLDRLRNAQRDGATD